MNPIVPLRTPWIADLLPPLSLLIGLDPPLVAVYACNCQERKKVHVHLSVGQSHILRGKTNGDFYIKASYTHYQIYLFYWDHFTSIIYVTIFASGSLKILFYTSVFLFDEIFSEKLYIYSDLSSIYTTVFKFSRHLK